MPPLPAQPPRGPAPRPQDALKTEASVVRERVGELQREVAAVFTLLADALPQVNQECASLATSSEAIGAQGQVGLDTAARTAAEAAGQLSARVSETVSGLDAIDGVAARVAEMVSAVVRDLAATNALAMRMRILALNALVAAAHDEKNGGALVVLTDALVGVAREASSVARSGREASDRIQTDVSAVRHALEELRTRRAGLKTSTHAAMKEATGAPPRVLVESFDAVRAARAALVAVPAAVADVMEAIQRQDAVDQALELVVATMGEVAAVGTDRLGTDDAADALEAARRSAALLREVRTEVEGLCTQVERLLEPVGTAAASLSSVSQGRRELDERAHSALDPLHRALEAISEDGKDLARLDEALSTLAGQTRELPAQIAQLREITQLLRMLRVMIRIQLAQGDGGGSATAIVTQIDAVRSEADELVRKLEQAGDALPVRVAEMRAQLRAQAEAHEALRAGVEPTLLAAAQEMDGASAGLADQLSGVRELGEALGRDIARFRAQLTRVADTANVWDRSDLACERIAARMDGVARSASVAREREDAAVRRLHDLLERFSSFAVQRRARGAHAASPRSDANLELF